MFSLIEFQVSGSTLDLCSLCKVELSNIFCCLFPTACCWCLDIWCAVFGLITFISLNTKHNQESEVCNRSNKSTRKKNLCAAAERTVQQPVATSSIKGTVPGVGHQYHQNGRNRQQACYHRSGNGILLREQKYGNQKYNKQVIEYDEPVQREEHVAADRSLQNQCGPDTNGQR